MDIAATFLVTLLLLQKATGTYVHPQFEGNVVPIVNTNDNNGDAEIVGGILGIAHIPALRARARVHAIQRRARLRAHHLRPHLLLESTPEEFMHNAPGEDQNAEPILGQANPSESYGQYQQQPEAPHPDFSIPSHWKPPPDSNLYAHHDWYPSDEAVLSIVPGQWTNNDDYETYDTYAITPIAYDIPDDYTTYYGRSADPHKISKDKRHFHVHGGGHVHSHSFAYHGKPISHGYNHGELHQPSLHESFSSHSQTQEFNTPPFPPSSTHGHQHTANKQNTLIVLPPSGGNFQISQVSGNNNAVSQSQSTRRMHDSNAHNAQSGQIIGNHNAVSESQNIHDAAFVGSTPDATLGTPHIVNVGRNRKIWRISAPGETNVGADLDPIVGAPNVFNVGANRRIWNIPGPNEADVSVTIKRSIREENLADVNEQRKRNGPFVMTYPSAANPVVGTPNVFSVDGNRQIWQIARPEQTDISVTMKREIKNRQKRSVPLLRLLVDPNTRMDVPKTMENMGTVARNSFENKRAPVYHLKNAMGSAKDVFMSSLRIPPQDLFIPSKYKIVEKSLDSTSANEKSNNEIPKESETYNKVGEMFRESVRSGQNALTHAGDFAHSARKAFASSRHAAPRVVFSSLRIPAVEHPLLTRKDKAVLITPKVIQTRQEAVGTAHYSESDPNFVGVNHALDALGLSNPDAKDVESRRIIFEPALPVPKSRGDYNPPSPSKKYYVLSDVLQEGYRDEKIQETLHALDNAQRVVGVNTLKDFFSQMKTGFKSRNKESKAKLKMRMISEKFKKKPASDRNSRRSNAIDALDMVVSLASNVTNELLNDSATEQPVSDSAEEREVSSFLMNLFNVSDSRLSLMPLMEEPEENFLETNSFNSKRSADEGVLRAINPVMFQQLFNTSLETAQKFDYTHPDFHPNHSDGDQNHTVGIGMTMGKALVTPFMGKLEKQEVHPYDYRDGYADYDDY